MEGPISFWGYKEQESNLLLPEHDDDDEKEYFITCDINWKEIQARLCTRMVNNNTITICYNYSYYLLELYLLFVRITYIY